MKDKLLIVNGLDCELEKESDESFHETDAITCGHRSQVQIDGLA